MHKHGDYRRILEEQLTRLKTDHIDFYHFHGINYNGFTEIDKNTGWHGEAVKAKDEGLIKHISFSFHSRDFRSSAPDDMIKLIDTGYFESVLCQYNVLDQSNAKAMELAEVKYDYQVIVTNIEYLTAEEIFHDYNQRCDIENKIDELKEGFAFDQNSRRNKDANEMFLLLKMIAYNLHNWFKSAILPEEWSHCEIKTIRRKFYNLAANICGTGRYRHIRYAWDKAIENLITAVIDRLRRFQLAAA